MPAHPYRLVFWLPDPSTCRALPPNRQWHHAVFVPGYSGGSAPDFNGIPSTLRLPPCYGGSIRNIIYDLNRKHGKSFFVNKIFT